MRYYKNSGEFIPRVESAVPHEPIMGRLQDMYTGWHKPYKCEEYTPWVLPDWVDLRGKKCLMGVK